MFERVNPVRYSASLMAASNSGVPWSTTWRSNSAGRSERAISTSGAGSFGESTTLIAIRWSPLLELAKVFGEVRRERVRLHRSVGVEAHGEVLGDRAGGAGLGVEPAPRQVAAVDPSLVRIAEDLEQRGLVGGVGLDLRRVGGGEFLSDTEAGAGRGDERDDHQPEQPRAVHTPSAVMPARRRLPRRGARSRSPA